MAAWQHRSIGVFVLRVAVSIGSRCALVIDSRIGSALGQLIHKLGESSQPTVVAPDPTMPMRLLVVDGHLVGLKCGGTVCVQGLAHDLQALLVASSAATDPAPTPATPELVGTLRGPRRSPVAEAVAVCEAAVFGGASVPSTWIDLHARMILGPGPDPGERTVFGHHEWRTVRLLLLGGLPAVAAGDAWHIAAQVLRSRTVVVAGTENCPVLARWPVAGGGNAPAHRASLGPTRIPGAALASLEEEADDRGAVDGGKSLVSELAALRRKATAAAMAAPVTGQPVVGDDVLRRIIDHLKAL
jgi:hypothetical protein